jgi:hypothetical protein
VKKLLVLVAIAGIFVAPAKGQITYFTVTAGVTDPNGSPYANASYIISLVDEAGNPVATAQTPNGSFLNTRQVTGTLDATGHLSVQLAQNNTLHSPDGTQWKISISSPTDPDTPTRQPSQVINYQTPITGSVDLSSQLSALAAPIASSGGKISQDTPQLSNAPKPGGAMGGVRYATAHQRGSGDNGIANAAAEGQMVVADPGYGSSEQYSLANYSALAKNKLHFQDIRNGIQTDFFHNWGYPRPSNFGLSYNPARADVCVMDGTVAGSATIVHNCTQLNLTSTMPGFNLGNAPVGGVGWHTISAGGPIETVNGSGITHSFPITQSKFGVGDNIPFYVTAIGTGGATGFSDEGFKLFGGNVTELPGAYLSTCSTGCTRGSTLIKTTATANGGSQGTGKYVIDTTQAPITAKVTGLATGLGGAGTTATLNTSVPVSNVWGTLASNVATPLVAAPPFTTSMTFNVNIVGGTQFDTTHLVCFKSQFHECSIPTAVGTPSRGVQSITIPLRRGHASGTYVFQGGMAGYGIEFVAYTQTAGSTLRWLFDVVGSTSATTIEAVKYIVGSASSLPVTSTIYNYINLTGCSNAGTTVTCTYNSVGSTLGAAVTFNQGVFVIANASDSALNGNCTTMTWTSATAFTCTEAGLSGSHSGVTARASLGNSAGVALNSVKLWPIAEALDVQNETTTPPAMDGTFNLEPNIVPFASGDIVEQTHHASSIFGGFSLGYNTQNPFLSGNVIGIVGNGPGMQGGNGSQSSNAVFRFLNTNSDSYYQGGGGFLAAQNMFNLGGPYSIGFNFDHAPQPNQPLLVVNATGTQRNDVNYSYYMFQGTNRAGAVSLQVKPNSGDATLSTGGVLTLAGGSGVSIPNLTATGTFVTPIVESIGRPSLSGCSLAGAVGGAGAGAFNSGTTGTCAVVITPGITAAHGFRCSATDLTTPADLIGQTAFTTTTCTISGTTVRADLITWEVIAF